MRPGPLSPQAWSPSPGSEHAARRAAASVRDVGLRRGVGPHQMIHGRRHGDRRGGRQTQRTRAGHPPGRAPGARGNPRWPARSARASAQRASSMWPIAASAAASHSSLRTLRPETAWKVVARHELARRGRHDDLHLGAALAQPAHEVRTLVGGDAAGHAEQNALALHGLSGLTFPSADYCTASGSPRKPAHTPKGKTVHSGPFMALPVARRAP